jgi:seryl-tRNA synthetase
MLERILELTSIDEQLMDLEIHRQRLICQLEEYRKRTGKIHENHAMTLHRKCDKIEELKKRRSELKRELKKTQKIEKIVNDLFNLVKIDEEINNTQNIMIERTQNRHILGESVKELNQSDYKDLYQKIHRRNGIKASITKKLKA